MIFLYLNESLIPNISSSFPKNSITSTVDEDVWYWIYIITKRACVD